MFNLVSSATVLTVVTREAKFSINTVVKDYMEDQFRSDAHSLLLLVNFGGVSTRESQSTSRTLSTNSKHIALVGRGLPYNNSHIWLELRLDSGRLRW